MEALDLMRRYDTILKKLPRAYPAMELTIHPWSHLNIETIKLTIIFHRNSQIIMDISVQQSYGANLTVNEIWARLFANLFSLITDPGFNSAIKSIFTILVFIKARGYEPRVI